MLCSLDVQGADLPIDDVAVFLKLWSNFDQILFPIPTRSSGIKPWLLSRRKCDAQITDETKPKNMSPPVGIITHDKRLSKQLINTERIQTVVISNKSATV